MGQSRSVQKIAWYKYLNKVYCLVKFFPADTVPVHEIRIMNGLYCTVRYTASALAI